MPIYEFYCARNRTIYSFFARSLAYAAKTPRCPDDAGFPLERMISKFAVTGRAKEPSAAVADAPDDPRMERAMLEMESEMAALGDGENPDPRALARMMRKMTDLTGEPMPAAMGEMIARLEQGEDPDKLEQEYGDVMDGFDPGGGGGDETEKDASAVVAARRRSQRIERDPKLYEMAEYCD